MPTWKTPPPVESYSDPGKAPAGTPPERLVWRRLAVEGKCWTFQGRPDSGGYGILRSLGVNFRAHVVAWEHHAERAVPRGLEVDHLCRVRQCARPTHLEPVTPAENLRRGVAARLGNACARGHLFTPENTYLRPDGRGRQCIQCIRMRTALYAA